MAWLGHPKRFLRGGLALCVDRPERRLGFSATFVGKNMYASPAVGMTPVLGPCSALPLRQPHLAFAESDEGSGGLRQAPDVHAPRAGALGEPVAHVIGAGAQPLSIRVAAAAVLEKAHSAPGKTRS